MLRFEWNEFKNNKNRIKHGIWFEEVLTIFNDPRGRLFLDDSYAEEERYILIGMTSSMRILIVVHCYRDKEKVIRIISARKPTKSEVRFYEEGI